MVSDAQEARHSGRGWAAGLALVIPAVAAGGSRFVWLPGMETVAFHWDAGGRPDGFIAADVLSLVAIAGAVLAGILGAVVLALPRMGLKDRRDYVFWAGSFAGFSAAIWLIPGWLTHQAGTAASASLGGWLAGLVAAMLYGVVPYALLPRGAGRPHQHP